ncbi:DUF5808 domain-containing protein [Saccharicrinis fermentans]|uniref:Putative membrane protein n=1 Tax=Saccharicrinis fermentans DSM 9555 = JCM 21142 TaxID=869213 RepID=W7Y3J8_9BACT|nr:DUF5808 domain-containing protein [Saccharicrinis fermentans]GAF05445.1 putative membrane protein [Saccharicrinis fermentans DSM 9555 = JCM 21142]
MRPNGNKQQLEPWIGVFYFNRKDSRVIVPKKVVGVGWTLNFANPRTYVFIIAVILIVFIFNYLS